MQASSQPVSVSFLHDWGVVEWELYSALDSDLKSLTMMNGMQGDGLEGPAAFPPRGVLYLHAMRLSLQALRRLQWTAVRSEINRSWTPSQVDIMVQAEERTQSESGYK